MSRIRKSGHEEEMKSAREQFPGTSTPSTDLLPGTSTERKKDRWLYLSFQTFFKEEIFTDKSLVGVPRSFALVETTGLLNRSN